MQQTLFLGVATVLVATGSFLASRQHFYSANSLFVGAILMVLAAIWVSYRNDYRLKRGKRELGRALVELSQCELAAYDGTDGSEYDKLLQRIEQIKNTVKVAARYLDDSSIESRFLAVNVLDIELNEATKRHFIDRAQGSFWNVYQKIKGWRLCVERMLGELRR